MSAPPPGRNPKSRPPSAVIDQAQRERIRDDLTGVVRGEFLADDLNRALYSTDASIFQVTPAAVVAPLDEADVQAVVRYAAEHNIPVAPRGAGSGLAGESLTPGIVIDLSRHMRSVLEVGAETVRVQPGVVHRELNRLLAHRGRRFAPDPTSTAQCTIGGMVATDASGPNLLRHGSTRANLAALRAVLDTGDAAVIAGHPREQADVAPGHLQDIVAALWQLLDQHADLIRASRRSVPFDRCGYSLHDLIDGERLDLAKLIAGSEGTLAVVTEIVLKTVLLPGGVGHLAAGYASTDDALRGAERLMTTNPVACEIIDSRLLSLARGADPSFAALVPAAAEAVVLAAYEASSPAAGEAITRDAARLIQRTAPSPTFVVSARDPAESAAVGRGLGATPASYGLRGAARPVAVCEDVAVPSASVPDFIRTVVAAAQRRGVTISHRVSPGTGHVQAFPFLDLTSPADVARLSAFAEEVHGLALDAGGTVSARHGTGLARTRWVARQHGALYALFRELKAIFDPKGILNPGKIVGPAGELPSWPLRISSGSANGNGTPGPVGGTATQTAPLTQALTEAAECNGCAVCRAESAPERMCPIFRATHEEAATPRAKANLLRHLLQSAPDRKAVSSDEVRAIADLCVNCRMCALECPTRVDVPRMMLAAKAANVAEHGLERSDWVLAHTEGFAGFGSALSFLVNAVLASPTARWVIEKLFGVSRRRRLPPFTARSFLDRARRRGWTRPPSAGRPRVAYFADVYANYNDPLIGEAVVNVLHHQGIDVYVPPGQIGCGMAPLAQGDVELAAEAARANVRVLAEAAREGYPVICSEPTAALMLRDEYPALLGDSDARLVAGRTIELTTYLANLHAERRLRTDFRRLDLSVGHHVPCHLKALRGAAEAPHLLALIPGLRVRTIDVSCSGMAGTFGLKAINYETSLRAGSPMLRELAGRDIDAGSTECSTCRMQMEEGSRKRTLHPVQYLALAYGLMPELARRLYQPVRRLTLR